MENNTEKVTPAAETVNAKSCRGSDARTFWIALLTSVIVVALYHFGGGLYKIWSGEYENEGFFCRKRARCEYRVVPVMCPAMMMQHCPMMRSSCEKAHFRKGHHPRRDKMARRTMMRKNRERAVHAERRHHFRKHPGHHRRAEAPAKAPAERKEVEKAPAK